MNNSNPYLKLAHEHNSSIDTFINVTLREYFGSDTVNAVQWFEAQQLINKQHFYEKGKELQNCIRGQGYDCKMDMQSNKLLLNGEYI